MAAKHKSGAPRPIEGAAGEAEEEAWTGPRASEVVYDRNHDRERALGAGQRWEEDEEEGEDDDGQEGYQCQICGYHANQLQPFNIHLHTSHPAVVMQELYGLLGLTGTPGPGLFGAPIPGLGVTIGPRPSLVSGLVPSSGLGGGQDPVWTRGPIARLGLTGGPDPSLTEGPTPGLGLTRGPDPSLTGGPIPGLGLTGGHPHPSLSGGPTPRLGLTAGPIPALSIIGGPDPSLTGGPTPGPSLTRVAGCTMGDIVHIDLTGEDDAGEASQGREGSQLVTGPVPSPETADPLPVEASASSSRPKPPPTPDLLCPELEAGGPLAESFSRFPYPSPAELARCGLSAGLPADRVRVWFAVQRLRRGISWTPEEVREARDKLRRAPGPLKLSVPPAPLGPGPAKGQGGHHRQAPASPEEPRGPRCRKTKGQLAALRSSFSRGPYLDQAETRRLQARTGLGKAEIMRWFSDSRYQRRKLPASSRPEAHGLGREAGPQGRCPEEGSEEGPREGCHRPQAPSLGRPRKSKEQLAVLKGFFLRCRWPGGDDYSRLVELTGLARADIIQWFGDTRYALKNGQLKWVQRGSVALAARLGDGGPPPPGRGSVEDRRWAPPLGLEEAGSEEEEEVEEEGSTLTSDRGGHVVRPLL